MRIDALENETFRQLIEGVERQGEKENESHVDSAIPSNDKRRMTNDE
jgi:hypothetical protein